MYKLYGFPDQCEDSLDKSILDILEVEVWNLLNLLFYVPWGTWNFIATFTHTKKTSMKNCKKCKTLHKWHIIYWLPLLVSFINRRSQLWNWTKKIAIFILLVSRGWAQPNITKHEEYVAYNSFIRIWINGKTVAFLSGAYRPARNPFSRSSSKSWLKECSL